MFGKHCINGSNKARIESDSLAGKRKSTLVKVVPWFTDFCLDLDLISSEHAASCPPKLPPYVPLRKDMKKDEEIVSATLEVLLPIWETRFVTLVGDNLTVYKGRFLIGRI